MSVPLRWQEPLRPEEIQVTSPLVPRRTHVYRRTVLRKSLLFLTSAGVGALIALGTLSAQAKFHATQNLKQFDSAVRSNQVSLGVPSIERHLGYITITGTVLNRTTHDLHSVETVIELLDNSGKTLGMETGLIAFDPLPAGQSAPFRVVMNDASLAVGYRVRCKELSGQLIN